MAPLGDDPWPSCSLLYILMPLLLLHAAVAADAAHAAYTLCVSYVGPTCVLEWCATWATLKSCGHEAFWLRAIAYSLKSWPLHPEPYGRRMTALGNDPSYYYYYYYYYER